MADWQPIAAAPVETSAEILGCRWYNGKMTKEPFITFWSLTLGRFYLNPTHFIHLPEPPHE